MKKTAQNPLQLGLVDRKAFKCKLLFQSEDILGLVANAPLDRNIFLILFLSKLRLYRAVSSRGVAVSEVEKVHK